MTSSFRRMTVVLALPLSLLIGSFAVGDPPTAIPRFAGLFSDHAVLQRDMPVHLWGAATPLQQLTVTLNTQKAMVIADASGQWQANLPAMPAGGPYQLAVGNDVGGKTTLNDVMLGDVFLCSGQSNMEFKLKWSTGAFGGDDMPVNNYLRFITIPQDAELSPQPELSKSAVWKVAGPVVSGEASAVCYYMANEIWRQQNVPIGMIASYWGGTLAQSWISESGLRSLHIYDPALDAVSLYAKSPELAKAQWLKSQGKAWQLGEPDLPMKLKWIKAQFDDSSWKAMVPDRPWEESNDPDLQDFDGIVWFRQSLDLTRAQATSAVRLNLGPIDDADVTWINGVNIGITGDWQMPRSYLIPAHVLKTGRNVIVVRVLDTGGGGGLWGKPTVRALTFTDGTLLQLPEAWKYKISGPLNPGAPALGEPWAHGLASLYNGMIAPLTPFHIRAVAWYQGEANTYSPGEYAELLPALMHDWRTAFKRPDLPFMIVQLANFGPAATKPVQSKWAELRDVQRRVVDADLYAALTVAIDVGDRTDIHPAQKAVIGQRLARNARAIVYREKVTPGGPEAISVARSGNDLIVHFKNTNGGLRTYSSDTAMGFEVCAAETCKYCTATLNGDAVVLEGANSPAVRGVRYAWADSPYVNLYSADDLPAVPFQLDVAP